MVCQLGEARCNGIASDVSAPGRLSLAGCRWESLAQGRGACGIMNGHGTNLINGIDQSSGFHASRRSIATLPCTRCSGRTTRAGVPFLVEEKRSKQFSQYPQYIPRQIFYDNKPSSKERP